MVEKYKNMENLDAIEREGRCVRNSKVDREREKEDEMIYSSRLNRTN